jgi:hypothetical protein
MDDHLRKRLQTMADPTGSGSWQEVLDLADRSQAPGGSRYRRRLLRSHLALTIGAGVLLVLIVAPALAMRGDLLPFTSSERAPQAIQSDFDSLDVGAPRGMAPEVSADPRRVISIRATDGGHSLWVAPTRGGGFCVQVDQLGGGCDRDRQLPLSVEMGRRTMKTPLLLWGSVLYERARSVDLAYEDGETSTLAVKRVTAPIDAGFFLFELPNTHEQAGARPIAAIARDEDGDILAREVIFHGVVFTRKYSPSR